jgi:4-amino-4-deoxy-L-arabinose transferase-like glycosyltransferase
MPQVPVHSSNPQVPSPVAPPAGIAAFCARHYTALALLTLALAALNLGYRLDREIVTTWDESLYATSAAEMVRSGNWLVTTFQGDVDYYNTKPPLNVWLIATSFKLFGINLWALRLPSALAAFGTIAIVQAWCRRHLNATTAILATIVLSTTFGFLYVHSGRSGNPDAWLALDILLTVVTLWSARTSPWRLVWIGPLAAVAFLLKGMAVLMPLSIVVSALALWRMPRRAIVPLATAAVVFAVPTGAWAFARWNFDRWRFFDGLFNYDFVAAVSRPLEGHEHSWLFYLNVLQKDHYDWLATAVILLLVIGLARRDQHPLRLPGTRDLRLMLAIWAGATLLIPTVMATKVAWYLNPFYPLFAIVVAAIVATGLSAFSEPGHRREQIVIVTMVLLAFAVAESKLAWYSFKQRDLDGSMQGFFLKSREMVEGRRVLLEQWDPADHFVLAHIAHGRPVTGNPQEVAAGADEHDLLILMPARDGGWVLSNARDIAGSPEPAR